LCFSPSKATGTTCSHHFFLLLSFLITTSFLHVRHHELNPLLIFFCSPPKPTSQLSLSLTPCVHAFTRFCPARFRPASRPPYVNCSLQRPLSKHVEINRSMWNPSPLFCASHYPFVSVYVIPGNAVPSPTHSAVFLLNERRPAYYYALLSSTCFFFIFFFFFRNNSSPRSHQRRVLSPLCAILLLSAHSHVSRTTTESSTRIRPFYHFSPRFLSRSSLLSWRPYLSPAHFPDP